MNFRGYLEAVDKWQQAEAAIRTAKQRIGAAAGGIFRDLADFSVMSYTNEELQELGEPIGNWVGQYVRGSVDSTQGATVLLQLDQHQNQHDMADTITHEMGHALWELLDDQSRAVWNQHNARYRWGAEEAFADDFMRLCNGQVYLMNNHQLFMQIVV